MYSAKFWVEHLGLQPHLEGGFYRQTYVSSELIAQPHLPPVLTARGLFPRPSTFCSNTPIFRPFTGSKATKSGISTAALP